MEIRRQDNRSEMDAWRAREPDLVLARRLNWINGVLTIVVLALAGAMRQVKFDLPEGVSTASLPAIYSLINVAVAGLLVVAWVQIRRGQVRRHRNTIHAALAGSAIFLVLYVVYHFTNTEQKFPGTGAVRVVYLTMLFSHIVLAAVSLPFILYTWSLGMTNRFARHRQFARVVFPVWLYVAITGPLCHVMLQLSG